MRHAAGMASVHLSGVGLSASTLHSGHSLKSLLILTMKARLTSGGNPLDPVSRPSLYTTNSSLPGRYSQRNRALVEKVWLLELYWVSALTNMRGVIV